LYLSNFPKASFIYSGDKDTNNYPHNVEISNEIFIF
jgi:hypothetical protein